MKLGGSNEAIVGEIERLLAVEREIDSTLEDARRKAAAIRQEAETDCAARERDRVCALEEEVAAKKSDLLRSLSAEIQAVANRAAAAAARYDDLPEVRVAEIAERIADALARGGEP